MGAGASVRFDIAGPFIAALLLAGGGCTGGSKGGDAGVGPGSVIDAGGYTLTILAAATAGSCDVHAQADGGVAFTETTADWGLAGLSFGNLYSVDLDGDGYTDLVGVSGPGRELIPAVDDGGGFHNLSDGGFDYRVAVLMNRPKPGGGRRFVDETAQSGLFQVRGGSLAEYREAEFMAFADVNNDGYVDAFSVVGFAAPDFPTLPSPLPQDQNEILLNDGHGHFTLAPQSAPSQILQPSAYQSIFTDVDNDGNLDLFMTFWSTDAAAGPLGTQVQLLKGAGDGTFTQITPMGMLTDDTDVTITAQGIPQATVNNLIAGTDPRPSFSAVACDLNGDGYPELLVGSYGGQSNMLFVNDGTGNYARQLDGDGGFDGDSDVDYHDQQYYLCYCTYPGNPGTPYCADAGAPNVAACPGASNPNWYPGFTDQPALLNGNNFGTACRDMNGDGVPDIFQGTIRHWWAGESSDPSALMINQTPQSPAAGPIDLLRLDGGAVGLVFPHWDPNGWNEGVEQDALADMDNDGYPDIVAPESDYAYQYTRLFKQLPGGSYAETAFAWGLVNPCMSLDVVADLDRDGDLDLVENEAGFNQCGACGPGQTPADGCGGWVATSDSPAFSGWSGSNVHIFSNSASKGANWLELRLRASDHKTNASGLGARVTVTVDGVDQVQDLMGGHGIGSRSDDPGVLFYGLGACGAVDRIKVRWPNQALGVDSWQNVPANHLIELRQGDPTIYGVNLY